MCTCLTGALLHTGQCIVHRCIKCKSPISQAKLFLLGLEASVSCAPTSAWCLHAGSGSNPAKTRAPLQSHTSLSTLQQASSNSQRSPAQKSALQSRAGVNSPSSLQRTSSSHNSSNTVPSPLQQSKLQHSASLKGASSLQRSGSTSSPRNPYLQGASPKVAALQRKGSSSGLSQSKSASVVNTSTAASTRLGSNAVPGVSSEGISHPGAVEISQSRAAVAQDRFMTGQKDAAVAEVLDAPIVRHKVCQPQAGS